MNDTSQLDNTGKVSLEHIYTAPDPRDYFITLQRLGYCIPQLALPHFARLIDTYRRARRVSTPTIVDIGSSYGINAALIRYGTNMNRLYKHYGCQSAGALCRDALIKRDRMCLTAQSSKDDSRWVGLDRSAPALAYAIDAGLLDDAINADFEHDQPSAEQLGQLENTDIVLSTGCVGYVTEKTITRIIDASGDKRPWMAHFVLRMFSFKAVADALAVRGYETRKVAGVFRQRRFAVPQEQARVFAALADAGVDYRGVEDDGWLYAELYISTPANESRSMPTQENSNAEA